MSQKSVPLTIQAVNNSQELGNSAIVIGSDYMKIPSSEIGQYWFVVVDRTNLKVVANFTTTDNSSVPSQLSPYLNNTQYCLILTTFQLGVAHLPTGNLYNFLISEGADVALKRGEQLYEALNCAFLVNFAYTFVAVFGDDGGQSFEGIEEQLPGLLTTLQFVPVDVAGTTYYTPAAIG